MTRCATGGTGGTGQRCPPEGARPRTQVASAPGWRGRALQRQLGRIFQRQLGRRVGTWHRGAGPAWRAARWRYVPEGGKLCRLEALPARLAWPHREMWRAPTGTQALILSSQADQTCLTGHRSDPVSPGLCLVAGLLVCVAFVIRTQSQQ